MNHQISDADHYFGIVDYIVFFALLMVSIFVGLYVAFFGKEKQNTIKEYLLGSKKMAVFPTAMSLTASYIHVIVIAGLPAEIYTYGSQYWLFIVGEILACILVIYVSLPVFYTLQLTSIFEYLKLRYDNTTRMLISFLFIIRKCLAIPLTLYVPALILSQASGLSLNILIPVVCFVCTFYTTIGGLKAVVWTDTIQMSMIVIGLILVCVMGTIDIGGFKEVWDINERGGRLQLFNMNFNIDERLTFWNVFIGAFISFYSALSVDQAMVQRCLSLPSYVKAKTCMIIFGVGFCIFFFIAMYNGLIVYAAFHDCDPLTTKAVTKSDQLLLFYIIQLMENIPGLPGLFVSSMVCAALTTLSTDFNSLAGVMLIDLLRPIYKKPIAEGIQSWILKMFVIILGCYAVSGAFFITKLGNLIQTIMSLSSIVSSPVLGVFLLGILFPWANSTGAMVGVATGTIFLGWISFGAQVAISNKQITYPKLPVSIEGCSNATLDRYYDLLNHTVTVPISDPGEPFPLYKISFMWYSVIGFLTTFVVGIIVSFITGPNNPRQMDPDLFSPIIRPFLHTEVDVVAKARLVKVSANGDTKENE